MMRFTLVGLCALVVLACGGCQGPDRRGAALDAFAATDTQMPTDKGSTNYVPPTTDAEFNSNTFYAQHARRSYVKYQNAVENHASVIDRTRMRDEVALSMITLIQHYHEGTTDDAYELTSSIETLFDMFGLVFSGLGATTGSAVEKAAYAAVTGGLTGFRGSLHNNVLGQQTKFAIIQQMEALRDQKETQIRQKLRSDNDDSYSLREVVCDIGKFYSAGSMKDAVAALVASATSANTKAKSLLASVSSRGVSGTTSISGAKGQLLALITMQSTRAAAIAADTNRSATDRAEATSINTLLASVTTNVTAVPARDLEFHVAETARDSAKRVVADAEADVKTKTDTVTRETPASGVSTAALATAQAELATAQATLTQARTNLATAEATLQTATTNLQEAEGKVKQYASQVEGLISRLDQLN